MSPQFYYVLHLAGVLLVFLAYGLLIARAMLGSNDATLRKFGSIASGVGLVLILVGGFGLLAKIWGNTFHPWVIIKLVTWVLLGGAIALINRLPHLGRIWFWVVFILGLVSILAVYLKPGM